MSSSATKRAAGLDILQPFAEPWETRLGMAEEGFRGRGGAEDIGTCIWEALTINTRALLGVGILKHLEHLPLFVSGVARDITSDITTRIMFGSLAEFTNHVLTIHPEFTTSPHVTKEYLRQVWDPVTCAWTTRKVLLPIAGGKPLLLVPRGWVGHDILMSPTRFYETSLLTYVQDEQAVLLSSGKVAKTPRVRLKMEPDLTRGRETHLEVTSRAYRAGDDLIAMFQAFVCDRLEASDERDAA